MEADITVARIANSICQDTSFKGIHLLVEGRRDYKLYKKFANDADVRIKTTRGKYRLREIYALLLGRGVANVVGIRDADFLRIAGNPKYSAQYEDAIFPTDCHDAEIMIARSGVLKDYLTLIADPEHVHSFVAQHKPILDLVTEAIYPIGCLRLANKRFGLGLSFKPEKPEGNQLKVRKFVSESTWAVDVPAMVNTVWEYSQNRGLTVAPRDKISEALSVITAEGHPSDEISNGHDFCAVLHLVSAKGLKSTNKMLQDPSCVEDLLIAVFDLARFTSTELYSLVQSWSSAPGSPPVFRSVI
jgi:hypothetical protein